MAHCVFDGCVNHSGHMNKTHGIVFHGVPSENPCRQQWIDIIRTQRGEFDWTPSKYSKVCTLHFNPADVFRNIRGNKRIFRGAVPYIPGVDDNAQGINEAKGTSSVNVSLQSLKEDLNKQNLQDDINDNDSKEREGVVNVAMEAPQDKVEAPDDTAANDLPANNVQPTSDKQIDQANATQETTKDKNPTPLDKFKRRLIRAVARKIQQKKPEEEMWEDLKNEIGCDCKMLWQHMRALTLKKLKRLLPANDLLVNLKKIARFTATDWLLFDLILVHEKINVISINDMDNTEAVNREEPPCLHDLFELVKEHKVENVSGDDLIEAWIRVTLQYNSRGRQCSPMLLQLRWFQMKQLTRARFYNFWCAYRGNTKMLVNAMKYKPTLLQTEIAREYNTIVTETYPEWEKLIEDRCVILSEEFTLNREAKRKSEKIREENDLEIEVIEPEVETIELEVDSDEECDNSREKIPKTENSSMIKDNYKESVLDSEENKTDIKNSLINIKSESDDEVLELDGLSDVESLHIPLENMNEIEPSRHFTDNSTEEILNDSNVNKIFPKITNVIGNIVEPPEFIDEQRDLQMEKNDRNDRNDVKAKIVSVISLCPEANDPNIVQGESAHEMDKILKEKVDNLKNIHITQTDTNIMQGDSDNEIDENLKEKVDNLKNIEIIQIKSECYPDNEMALPIEGNPETCENLQNEKIDTMNAASNSSKKLSLCNSANETSVVVQENPNKYIDSQTPYTDVEITEHNLQEDSNTSQNIKDYEYENIHDSCEIDALIMEETAENEYTNVQAHHKIDEGSEATSEKTTVKIEKHDDGFDEMEFDDDQIEFVDDGIEFVEEIKEDKEKITHSKMEPLSDSEDENITEDNDYPKIDLKLLMNPTVYTKKLDVMNIFKFIDFNFVNDKNVIGSALLESKPVDKLALKNEDIDKLREKMIPGDDTEKLREKKVNDNDTEKSTEQMVHDIDTEDSQSDNDIIETATENSTNRVKCTSWLLQKPKNRSYNPIQLCKNPDFNTRLKRLTAGFLSSTSNRELLKECQPLTIDLHKAFEHKLINGTMYLKSDDFKSAKSTTIDKINDEPDTVLPSVLPDQSKVFTARSTNNDTTVGINKLDNQEDRLPLSPNLERRKIINLPDIDQVRRVNQSLLTAEVTPIRIDSNIDDIKSCQESDKTPSTDSAFVQPITLVPIVQIKNEPSDLYLDEKNKLQIELQEKHDEISTGKVLMANKINDQIITLSNEISEVDNNELLSVDVEKTIKKQPLSKKAGRKPQNNEKKSKPPQKINKLTYTPRYRGKLSWSPKYPKNHITDSLLTLDTLSKILFLLNGNEEEIKHCSCKQKKIMNRLQNDQQNLQIKQNINKLGTNEVQSTLTKRNQILKSNSAKEVQSNTKSSLQGGGPKRRNRKPRNPAEQKKYSGKYCCWAREKIINITKGNTNIGKHGCLMYRCQCCCREELVTLSDWKGIEPPYMRKKNKMSSTIVLSDDEDKDEPNQNDDKIVTIPGTISTTTTILGDSNLDNNLRTSNVATQQSDKVTIEILLPSLPSQSTADTCSGSANNNVNNIVIQTEIPQDNLLTDTCKRQEPPDKEKDKLKKQVSCKTVVHAADGHAYNKRVESGSSNFKEQNVSITPDSTKCMSITAGETPKQNENTLVLNSSQITNKPTKTPIYLGKNKILLCSLKNPSVAVPLVNPYLPVLPYGVHFVMLPNGELTLSIDNGTQLDSEQLAALPALMSTVQEQFQKSNISSKTPEDINISHENKDVKIVEESKVRKQVITNSAEYINDSNQMQDKSTEIDESVMSNKELLSDKEKISNLKPNDFDGGAPLNGENEPSTQITIQPETTNTESDSQKLVEEHLITEKQTDKQNIEPQLTVEDRVNNSATTENILPSPETRLNDNNDTCDNINTRKSILSDLMEMSGISPEDTSMVSDVTNTCSPVSTLPPNIIPVTKTSRTGNDFVILPTNSNVPENISIAGPHSNLLSFEPITPINHLLNCIAQIRPELNAVTSFAELKYVYENDGLFYKLDVDLGTISEIKVFIKKNPKSQISTTPKAYIDLTDETCDNENVTCAEFRDIPQDKHGNTEAKPIKLFKAVHPAILKRTGRSILKENEVAYPKKVIRVSKQRRKQLLNIGNKYVLVDIDKINELEKHKDPAAKDLDSSYDSSDDEPLAKKSKRNKPPEKIVEKTYPIVEDASKLYDSAPEETSGIPDMNSECGDTSDLEMNSMDIEGVNPELHPVAFEEGSESDEDMCILGV